MPTLVYQHAVVVVDDELLRDKLRRHGAIAAAAQHDVMGFELDTFLIFVDGEEVPVFIESVSYDGFGNVTAVVLTHEAGSARPSHTTFYFIDIDGDDLVAQQRLATCEGRDLGMTPATYQPLGADRRPLS